MGVEEGGEGKDLRGGGGQLCQDKVKIERYLQEHSSRKEIRMNISGSVSTVPPPPYVSLYASTLASAVSSTLK